MEPAMILVQLTDLHVRPRGLPAYRVAETNMLTERALRAVRALRFTPDAIVISGDLTDNGLPAEYAVLAEMLKRLVSVPVYVIPGNHDRRAELKAGLSALPGVNDDPDFVHYTVDHLPVRLVMLDTIVPGGSHGMLCPARLEWLERQLAAEPTKPTMIVMHHPPFLCGIRHMDAINLRNAAEFTAMMQRHPQVQRILCGHHHRPVNVAVGHAIASIAPSVAHQVEFDLSDDPGYWNLEPAAFQVHVLIPDQGIASHTVYVENYPGPYPFLADPDYPGK
jgi:3',5'-cyclic AMP phosphodiesterase CpdA